MVYWVIGIFLRFILPSLSRGCLAHTIGTHSPRLHFCREPISHLACVGGNHPCISVAAQPVSLWETTPHRTPYDARIMPTAAVHRYQLGLYPSEVPLGSRDFLVLGRPTEPTIPAAGLEPTPVSVIKPLTITQSGIWCQRVESNH